MSTPLKTPLVSVVIPTHNRAWCLKETIESVWNQTHTSWELIVVDDASSDETLEVLSVYPEVKVLRLDRNRGVSYARNRGIELAKGELICFLDSDDRWLPQKLERQVAFMTEKPEAVACYTDEIWIRKGTRVNQMNKHRKYSGQIFKQCLPLCIISPSSIMLKRQLFQKIGDFDESLPACEDYDLWLRLASRFPVEFINEKLIVKYGGHEDQLSRRFWGMDRFRVRSMENLLASGHLGSESKGWVLEMLMEKCRILGEGFRKHQKEEEAKLYFDSRDRYSEEWDQLPSKFHSV